MATGIPDYALLRAVAAYVESDRARRQGALTDAQIVEIWQATSAEVAKLEAQERYTFAAWLPIAVRLVEKAHGIAALSLKGAGD